MDRPLVPEDAPAGDVEAEPGDEHGHQHGESSKSLGGRGADAEQGQGPGEKAPDVEPAGPEAEGLAIEPAGLPEDHQRSGGDQQPADTGLASPGPMSPRCLNQDPPERGGGKYGDRSAHYEAEPGRCVRHRQDPPAYP